MESKRVYENDILDLIKERWSPRGFDPEYKVSKEEIIPLIEAAGFAPSAFNEQPWRFIVGLESENKEDFDKIFEALYPLNQEWVKNSSALVVFCASKNFTHNNKTNNFSRFDTGSSFGLMSLQAVANGLHTHPMAGFDSKKIVENFNLGEDLEPIIIVVVGKYLGPEVLSEKLKEREAPSERRPYKESILNEI